MAQNENALEKLLSAAFEGSANAIFFVDLEGNIVACNPAFEKLMKRPAEMINGKRCRDILGCEPCFQKDCAISRIGATRRGEVITIEKDSRLFDIFLDPMLIEDEFVGIAHKMVDVTERITTQKKLERMERRYRNHFQRTPLSSYITNIKGEIIDTNLALLNLLGYPDFDSLRKVNAKEIFIESDERKKWKKLIRLKGEVENFEMRVRRRDGTIVWVEDNACAIRDDNGLLIRFEGSLVDITERKRKEESLWNQAVRDPLTGLHNRRFLEEALAKELSRARRSDRSVGVIMFDLDHFKLFNDRYGHAGGDALLEAFAEILLNSVREGDIACRYGGEEFVLVMPEMNCEQVRTRAEEIRQSLSILTVYNNGKAMDQARVSAGVAIYPKYGKTMAELLRAADAALYEAKRRGRNRVVVAQ